MILAGSDAPGIRSKGLIAVLNLNLRELVRNLKNKISDHETWFVIQCDKHHILSYQIISYHILLCHIISNNVISYHIISYHVISYHIISYHVISYHVISYHVISYHFISYHTISYNIMSYHIIWYDRLVYHIISYHIIIPYYLPRPQGGAKQVIQSSHWQGGFRLLLAASVSKINNYSYIRYYIIFHKGKVLLFDYISLHYMSWFIPH